MIRNSYILKTISLFLSFWMLFASAGLSVDFHYCEGEIVDWSIIGQELECEHEKEEAEKVDSCCEAKQVMACNQNESNHNDSNCCDTDEAQVIIENDFNISSEEINTTAPLLVLLSFFVQSETIDNSDELFYVQKQKPLIPINRRLATLETFLI
ncbi:hypothetical protein OAD28_04725 [Flavobacteriales bacterium]|jgi:hypothetical protein|nr:hypothetical protein [Flavobacteriales bacterium]